MPKHQAARLTAQRLVVRRPFKPMTTIESKADGSVFRIMSHIMTEQLHRLSEALQPLGISGPIWRVLSELDLAGLANINALALGTAFERSYVSRLLDEMTDEGWVERADHGDRRARVVQLSRTGRAKYRAASFIVGPLNRQAMDVLRPAEQAQLRSLLRRVAINVGSDRE